MSQPPATLAEWAKPGTLLALIAAVVGLAGWGYDKSVQLDRASSMATELRVQVAKAETDNNEQKVALAVLQHTTASLAQQLDRTVRAMQDNRADLNALRQDFERNRSTSRQDAEPSPPYDPILSVRHP